MKRLPIETPQTQYTHLKINTPASYTPVCSAAIHTTDTTHNGKRYDVITQLRRLTVDVVVGKKLPADVTQQPGSVTSDDDSCTPPSKTQPYNCALNCMQCENKATVQCCSPPISSVHTS